MQSLLLKYKLTVKVLTIFIQQVNHEKFIKRLLLGSRSICTEQTMQELVLNFLLNKPTRMSSLLKILQIFVMQETEANILV
jgi:hypothetical protein